MPAQPSSVAFSFKEVKKIILRNVRSSSENKSCVWRFRDWSVVSHWWASGGKQHPSEKVPHFSRTNTLILALVWPGTNLQICDVYMIPRYLAKYAMGIKDRSTVNLYSSYTDATFGNNVQDQWKKQRSSLVEYPKHLVPRVKQWLGKLSGWKRRRGGFRSFRLFAQTFTLFMWWQLRKRKGLALWKIGWYVLLSRVLCIVSNFCKNFWDAFS